MRIGSFSFKKIVSDLPLFLINIEELTLIYTPGFAYPVHDTNLLYFLRRLKDSQNSSNLKNIPNVLASFISKAREIKNIWSKIQNRPFIPTCLTINLSNECNLNCQYCFIGKDSIRTQELDLDIVYTTASQFIKSCSQHNRTFVAVFNGGGEPTYDWARFTKCIRALRGMGTNSNVPVFIYLSTNGAMDNYQVKWVEENIDLVSISCDGPPKINDQIRGADSSKYIENTIKILNDRKCLFQIRTTITNSTMRHQRDIVEYFTKNLKARDIRFEPAYGLTQNPFKKEDAAIFAKSFIEAEKLAKRQNALLLFSGVRINELHGPFCHSLRDTVHLASDGRLVNCFFRAENPRAQDIFPEAYWNSDKALLEKLTFLKKTGYKTHTDCSQCFNTYHCSRGCPDVCFSADGEWNELNEFRCRLHQLLAAHWIYGRIT
jgi:uncharacterized protein